MDTLSSYLPASDDGLLPNWLLFISVVSLGNSIQAYISPAGSREVYAGANSNPGPSTSSALPADLPPNTIRKTDHLNPPQVTELSARTFGTWTVIQALIRLYAAYNIHDKNLYELALWTFLVAGAHFASEWLIFGTARWGRGLAGPVLVASGTGTWMLLQWGSYVKG